MPETNAMTRFIMDGQTTSTGGRRFKVKDDVLDGAEDTRSENIGIIDIVHRKIHDGNHYTFSVEMTATNDTDFLNVFFLGQGSTRAKRHFTFEVSANQAGAIYLFEDMLTSGGGGTTGTALNNDRLSTNASVHKIEAMGTTHSCSTGTQLWAQNFGANQAPIRIGGSAYSRNEYILLSSVDYQVRFDPAAGNARLFLNATWYEE